MLTDLWERAAPNLADVRRSLERSTARSPTAITSCRGASSSTPGGASSAGRPAASTRRWTGSSQALSDILRAAFIHSEAGRRPESLQAAFGAPHHDQFDFETMSRLLGKGAPRDELPADRRERIEWALAALRRQRFFEPSPGTSSRKQPSHRSSTATAAAQMPSTRSASDCPNWSSS